VETNKQIKIGVAIIVIFVVGVFLKLAKPVLIPFCMAMLLSLAVTPVLDFLVARKIPKPLAMAGILLLTVVVLLLIGVLFYSSGKSLAAELPSYNEMMKSAMESADQNLGNARVKAEVMGWFNSLNTEKVGGLILSALGPFVSFMSDLLLVFVFMIFLLAGRGRMEKKITAAFPPEQAHTVARTMAKIDRQVQKYLAVKTMTCLITGVLTAVILAIFGLPFAIVFGVLTFLLNYIPTIGSIIATVPPVLMAVFYFGSIGTALGMAGLLTAVNIAIGNFVEPKLMGKGLGLSQLLVFFSLFFGSWLWGIPGMILAVPILAVLKIVFANVPSLKVLDELMG
jgi:AI-2 transport protein TqsA